MENKKINTTVFIVAKSFKGKEHLGVRLLPAKIIGYQNLEGRIFPILKQGNKEVSPELNHIFYNLEEAINAIKTKK